MAKIWAREISKRVCVVKVLGESGNYYDTHTGWVRHEEREFDLEIGLDKYGSADFKKGDRFILDGVEWEVIK